MIRSALALLAVCALFCPASAEAGRWLRDESGDPAGDYGISGLTHVGDTDLESEVVWAITDGECGKCGQGGPGYLLRIRARDARLTHAPIPIGVPVGAENDAQYAGLRDFECLTAVPDGSDAQRTFIAATENEETPRIVKIEVRGGGGGYTASIQSAVPIEGIEHYPGWEPENRGKNSRIEGCALGENDELYLAFERHRDGRPILFKTVASNPRVDRGLEIEADWMELLPTRNDKRPNFNGLAIAGDFLLILARDQERVIRLDLGSETVSAIVELGLVAPREKQPSAFSPEGIATDGTKVWIVNDPWVDRYREPLGGGQYHQDDRPYYRQLNSMLFERPLNYFDEPTAAPAGDDEVTPIEAAPTDEEPAAAMKPGWETAVEKVVRDWAAAWSAQRVDEYLSLYASTFRPASGLDRAMWQAERRRLLLAPECIRVEVSELAIQLGEGDIARATFRQTYESNHLSDRVRKTLELTSENGAWRIRSERASEKEELSAVPCPVEESARQEPPSPASERLDEPPPAPTPEQEREPSEDADLTDDGHETEAPGYGTRAWVVLIVVIFILAATWWRRRSN